MRLKLSIPEQIKDMKDAGIAFNTVDFYLSNLYAYLTEQKLRAVLCELVPVSGSLFFA